MARTEDVVIIEENAPRDGLQNEAIHFSIEERVELIDTLTECGFRRIQVGSFVNPRLVPNMAGTEEVFRRIELRAGVVYTALALNERGLERAVACGIGHVSLFSSASEAHSRRNANCSVEEGAVRVRRLIEAARGRGLGVQAGVMNAFGCRLEGYVPSERVLGILEGFVESGADEINLADTSGIAHPKQVEEMVATVGSLFPVPLALHLHDTYGFGLANVHAAWKVGARRFDASCGGLGGCPFIPDAAGNVATEDVVHLFEAMGAPTGISLEKLTAVIHRLEARLNRRLPGRYARLKDCTRT